MREYNLRKYMTHIFTLTPESTSDVTSLAAQRVMGAAGCAPRCQRTGGWSRTVYPGVMEISYCYNPDNIVMRAGNEPLLGRNFFQNLC